jgi:hypothetical protein
MAVVYCRLQRSGIDGCSVTNRSVVENIEDRRMTHGTGFRVGALGGKVGCIAVIRANSGEESHDELQGFIIHSPCF